MDTSQGKQAQAQATDLIKSLADVGLSRGGGGSGLASVLDGVRVLDVTTGPVGGMATMVLADFGADVVKVEPPSGDRFRALAASPLWLRGKRSVVADLNSQIGLESLGRLVAATDVLIVSGPPARARRWGIDADGAVAMRPDLVHCSITGWGASGPLAEVPGYEGSVSARSGRMLAFKNQLRRGGPVFSAVQVAGHVAAQAAVQGIASALIARMRGGGPQRVQTSLLQGFLPFDLVELLLVEIYERSGLEIPNPLSSADDMPELGFHPVRTSDGGWIHCGNLLEHHLMAFLDATGILEELLADGQFAAPPGSWDEGTVDAVRNRMLVRLQEKSTAEWMSIFRANLDVAAEPYITTVEALRHPDLVDGGDIVTLEDPQHGAVRMIGRIAELTATPAHISQPAPTVGQHTREVMSEWTSGPPANAFATTPSDSHRRQATKSAPPPGRPLDGVTVVEFSTIVAAPVATSMLADLGARVIKVESIGGDPYRQFGDQGIFAVKTTAGKSSICVDLKTPEGRTIARQLCGLADVVVHNARPGVPERLGLGEVQLRTDNPGLIWVALNGYSPHSSAAGRPATQTCAGAAAGGATYQAGLALTAQCDTLEDLREVARQLMKANESSPDPNSGVVLASAVTLALLARERFGIGQAIYVNMLAANMFANVEDAVDFKGRPPRPKVDAELHGTSALYRLYKTGEGWIFLAAASQREWTRAAEVLDNELARDPRFASPADRTTHDDELAAKIESALSKRSAAEWERLFVAAGVAGTCADKAAPGDFFAHDEQVLANGFSPVCEHARFGPYRRWGSTVTVEQGNTSLGPGVLAGEQTVQLLTELGYDDDEISGMLARNVVASEPLHVGLRAEV